MKIHLDSAASAPLCPEAARAMTAAWAEPGNAASSHAAGRAARRILEDARDRVARRLDADAADVVFTSGATEANNLALFGLAGEPPGILVATGIEHPSVAEPIAKLVERGFTVLRINVDSTGVAQSPLLPSPHVLRGRGVGGEGVEIPCETTKLREGPLPPSPRPSPPGVPGGASGFDVARLV